MRFAREYRAFPFAACSLALLLGTQHVAASLGAQQDPKNAATWYARSIAAWQAFKNGNPQQAELIANYAGDPSLPITPEIRAAITSIQGAIGDFKKGSQQEYCDFALDYSQGFELLLPHLGEMRGIARAMRADAAIRLADGDTAGAAAELASMYKTSGHFGDDRVLISSLVGQAVFAFADAGVQMGLDSAAFNAADAAGLLSGVQALGTDDPFEYAEAVGMEQEIALATFEKYRGAEGMKQLGEMLGSPEAAEKLGALDDAAFSSELEKYDQMMTRVNAAFAMTDKDAAMAEMKKISDEIEGGDFGVLASVIAPAFGKVLERKFAGEQMIADRIATLGALASGAQRPEEAANAALWYLRAIDMWEELPEQTRAAVLTIDAGASGALPQATITALTEIQSVLDVVREASAKRRCDFSVYVHHRGPPAVAPHYAPGMHELLTAIQLDGQRVLAAGDQDGAIERFAAVLRASAHLGGDINLAVCRTGQVHFNAIIDVLGSAQKSRQLDVHASNAASLADAASRVSRKDPFGYLAALQKARDDVITRFNINPERKSEDDIKRWADQMSLVRSFNSDQTMVMLIMLDERNRRLAANPPPAPEGAPPPEFDDITLPETIERLRGVFDPDAVVAVRSGYDEINQRFAQDDFQVFLGRPALPVANLNDGLSRARGDLRRATSLLMLPEELTETDGAKPAQP